MRTERADIHQLLQQMRQLQTGLQERRELAATSLAGLDRPGGPAPAAEVPGFGTLFQQAVGSVNAAQQQSSALATAYERGEPGVSLAQVMVASQKAGVSFQALTQVRNHLVDAYKDIMNMPI